MFDRPIRRAARRAIFIALLVAFVPAAAAKARSETAATGSDAELAAAAAAAYKQGDFAGAARAYEALRARVPRSGALLYNLGNAYLKGGDLGRAVANFERAALVAPRDAELRENLRIARDQCEDRPGAGARGPITRARESARALTPDEWALLMTAGYLLVLASSLLPYYAPRRAALSKRVALAGVLLLAVAALGIREWSGLMKPATRAAVVVPEASIRSGPGESYLGEFSLHPGSLVRVEERRGEWVKITYSPSLRGWTEATTLEFL